MHVLPVIGVLLAGLPAAVRTQAIVSSPGDHAIIPGWRLQSSLRTSSDIPSISKPGANVSSWYRIGSRATVMAGLIENGVFNETDLFYSDNLDKVDQTMFKSAWLYREEFTINSKQTKSQHFFLDTHGITSKANIFLNGQRIAAPDYQDGSYTGHRYDLTPHVNSGSNCLLIQAHPTNYLRDLAVGWADWNPFPPDNGTGVWRDVEISQTGSVTVSAPRVITDFSGNADRVSVTIDVDIANYDGKKVDGTLDGIIQSDDGSQKLPLRHDFQLKAHEKRTVSFGTTINNARIWWPALWGKQPLYTVQVNASVGHGVSDIGKRTRFGIRQIRSMLNSFNDTSFSINRQPFLVLGAGYSPDIFLRFDVNRVRKIFQYILDMGMNTVRLEGKMEHPEFHDLADEMGLMVMAGWECCDKWEGWTYNDDVAADKWNDHDYTIANYSMLHEAGMLQPHPSLLAFLVGSDYWPDGRATKIYVDAFKAMNWQNPIIASASKRGYAKPLDPSGMKMEGPYDWVPPNYWYGDQYGAAFGFGSEQGAGVGTPERESLGMFMTKDGMESLWTKPKQGQYHMSQNYSHFHNRSIYNDALFNRYGEPSSLDDYLRKAQILDYESTRAEFEAFSIRRDAPRPATGVIYWMLNSAWPNLHWQLFDYYLRPIGAYFGAKIANRPEHLAYGYGDKAVYVINHSLLGQKRVVSVDLIDGGGKTLGHWNAVIQTIPNSSNKVMNVPGIDRIRDVAFLRLVLQDPRTGDILSRNVYWLSPTQDVLDWDRSTWITTPVSSYSDYSALSKLSPSSVKATVKTPGTGKKSSKQAQILLTNKSNFPAFFVKLTLRDPRTGKEISPVFWSDNYVTLFGSESMTVAVEYDVSNNLVPLTVIKGAGHEFIPLPQGENATTADFHSIRTRTTDSPSYFTSGFYKIEAGPQRPAHYTFEETKYVLNGQIDILVCCLIP
ncbi:hypothetical protein ASPWEDRAFT_52033 [Aspergillus wentii DTO 134E9]|uniref:Exo-1,4-beta-D-glucosaminidase n=1 Tax=Aspergillus wentii DTO 134E9 TaxID=1073089 RepID=A0A1L9RMV4_ASPWE|nr:uncharacterized protein ASPWEDRAFT_52033 [Aspergillus wentii DTO 134E9]OJJ36213.1 hypothetical protein ASPWEDRAFT_52033 [Aspergillus wentii DTO 134E9]